MMGLIVKEQEVPNAGIKVVVIDPKHRPPRDVHMNAPALELPPGMKTPEIGKVPQVESGLRPVRAE
jgi:hypothetical protein